MTPGQKDGSSIGDRAFAAAVVGDSHALRAAVFQDKAVLMKHELDAIEARSGRNLDWHTRQTMQAASMANETVQSAALNNSLTADTVTRAMQPLQAAVDDTQKYLAPHPDAGEKAQNGMQPMWFSIAGSFPEELGRMRDLRTTLAQPASPTLNKANMVNANLQRVNMMYNGAVGNYNSLRQFAPVK